MNAEHRELLIISILCNGSLILFSMAILSIFVFDWGIYIFLLWPIVGLIWLFGSDKYISKLLEDKPDNSDNKEE